ncbi:hypothetical protein NEUTE2DRAFT_124021 [Neurospora tetrasperma FGSC 2509]|nr:hypothetical protein NEUTE2DRAFT_124021 [Neurospora tetrasperma FGSC 2509]
MCPRTAPGSSEHDKTSVKVPAVRIHRSYRSKHPSGGIDWLRLDKPGGAKVRASLWSRVTCSSLPSKLATVDAMQHSRDGII